MVRAGFKSHFSRFLEADPRRLHVAAHSHHPWPDVTFAAQQQAWLDAAELHDGKWERVFGDVLPEARRHVAGRLGLPDPATVVFAPNTHELVVRILSCLPTPARVLTTDGEFHSFRRQTDRLAEDGLVDVERVPLEPFASFPDRFAGAAGRGGWHLVFFSHVLFNSGYVVEDLPAVVAAVPDDDSFVVVDGYHGFLAVPTDLAAVADRTFYLAGGYKYAMAGEGCAFAHCPPGYGPRPRNTGWYASFGHLSAPAPGAVAYPADGQRFAGATFDPSGLYRFNSVQRLLDDLGLDVPAIHDHVAALERRFLACLDELGLPDVTRDALIPATARDRGHFLTFRTPRAGEWHDRLAARGVVCDHRADRLRLGFGIYHDDADPDDLCARLAEAAG